VVDSVGCVHGVGGLRVADASIFPTLVGEGGLQLPVVMAAEKIAHAVSAIHRRTSAGVAA